MNIKDFFKEYNKGALGFSGGVDSSYLLYAACECGADVQPYFVKTCFQPQWEYEDALKIAEYAGVPLKVIETDILNVDDVRKNSADRCYFCKRSIFSLVSEKAKEDGYDIIFDGTNASDDIDDRPGMKAIEQLHVLSPLRMCGLEKEEIRKLSRQAGLFTWDKPSYSCLATRIPAGTEIDTDTLKKVEGAEKALMNMGFKDIRVRTGKDGARIYIGEDKINEAAAVKKQILSAVSGYFDKVDDNIYRR